MRELLVCLLLLIGTLSSNAAIRLGIRSNPGGIGVGDKFQITVTFTNENAATPSITKVPGAKVLYPPVVSRQAESTTVINGNMTRRSEVEYTITLRATEKGNFTFGPLAVGKTRSNVLHYSIGGAGSANGQATAPHSSQQQGASSNSGAQQATSQQQSNGPRYVGKGNQNLFMVASISKSTAYQQEALVYTVKLYSTYDRIHFLGATEAPKFEGFVLEESKDVSSGLHFEEYKGKSYASAVIARYVIFPQMDGELKVKGNRYTVTVESRQNYIDPFFGPMSYGQPVQLSVQPNDLTVKVLPLPTPKPANFSGGVGKFTIKSILKGNKFYTNQAAPIEYIVSGSGNIKYVTMPDLSLIFPKELEIYTPNPTVNAAVNGGTVSGNVVFDYSFMPQREGNFSIPAVDFVYFNPNTGRYETATAKGYNITVLRGSGSSKSQTKEKAVFNSRLMEVNMDKLSKKQHFFAGTFGYWLFYILPVVALVVFYFWRRAYIKANADIISVKSRKANKMAVRRLRKASACMKRNDSQKFYDEILKALWGYAADKLKIPGSELTRDNIQEKLAARGVSEKASEDFIAIIDDCEFAKYAPTEMSGKMEQIYDRAYNSINEINASFK